MSNLALSSTVPAGTDPRDLNVDGKVTEAELKIYALRHPERANKEAPEVKIPETTSTKGASDLLNTFA